MYGLFWDLSRAKPRSLPILNELICVVWPGGGAEAWSSSPLPLCSSEVGKGEGTCPDLPSQNFQGHHIETRQENASSWFSTFMLWPQQKQKPGVPRCARMPCLTEQTVLGKHVGTEACCFHPSLPRTSTGLVTECRLFLHPASQSGANGL